MPSCDRPRPDLARGHRDDDLDRLESGVGGIEERLDLAVDRSAGVVREHRGLVRLVQAHVREDRVDLVAVVGRDERDRTADLVGGDRVERVEEPVIQSIVACCWRMYSADPATKPSTLFAFPVTNSLKYAGM